MAGKNVLGISKTYGPRYGRRLREKAGALAQEARRKHKCPYCARVAVRRIASGIWKCKTCTKTFTGKAYTISKKIKLREEQATQQDTMILEDEKETTVEV